MAADKDILTYEAPWCIYGMNWSYRKDKPFRLAIGSFLEDYTNKIQIVQLDAGRERFKVIDEFDHSYPTTKISWIPDKVGKSPDLLATTGDFLRLWELKNGKAKLQAVLNNSRNVEFCAPLTSFDWCENDLHTIGTSSIDTTCTIWDVPKQTAKTQLIAHDKEVYDIAFAKDPNVFATVGADGSVRMFDLRELEHSTIIYETAKSRPLLRLGWNKRDNNYLSTVAMDSGKLIILDVRVPSIPAAELIGHHGTLNALSWAPHSSCHICTAGDDKQALIWDLSPLPKPIGDPILAYNAGGEVNQLHWSSSQPDWIAIAFDKTLQLLRI